MTEPQSELDTILLAAETAVLNGDRSEEIIPWIAALRRQRERYENRLRKTGNWHLEERMRINDTEIVSILRGTQSVPQQEEK